VGLGGVAVVAQAMSPQELPPSERTPPGAVSSAAESGNHAGLGGPGVPAAMHLIGVAHGCSGRSSVDAALMAAQAVAVAEAVGNAPWIDGKWGNSCLRMARNKERIHRM
jgi:hypothetical protein